MKLLACMLLLGFVADINAIVRGSDAADRKYPYVVSIRSYRNIHICTGTILNKRWILSAATCLKNHINSKYVTVLVGSNTLLNSDGQVYQADNVTYHKNFEWRHALNDIGLIHVNRDIAFSKAVQPVVLPVDNNFQNGTSAVTTGWGATGNGGTISNQLQEISVKLLAQEVCNNYWQHDLTPISITDMHICSLTERGKGSCENDLGNPLLVGGVQVGIFTFYSMCASGKPEAFTRLFTYLDWIKNNAVIE
ncbi:hypothetical protein TSAR_009453 [Trichomalopsis sarcophagae]|uniref:Peptidase S1 domain-containing protein n=1 Tax=Trichomalopsis sarcophagae TaxID=543379 RepID=A0A232FG40_9HYME|nr:hypothetical protein TSAR_009453 [Trichomalopsis sarcophagae]